MSMRRIIGPLALASALSLPVPAPAGLFNGVLQEKDGQRLLRIWGTHYEMGYAHGFLMADEIIDVIDHYIIGVRWQPWSYENTIRPYVTEYFVLPTDYADELQGMLDGMQDSGADLFLTSEERELDFLDLHTSNLWGDFTHYCCLSVSAWGRMTEQDSILAGGAAMVRNFEYDQGPSGLLGRRSLLIAYEPSSPGERPWVSVAWPGMIGCLSGMNGEGLASATNGSQMTAAATPEPGTLIGHFFTVRDALENIDENGDGRESIDDVIYAIDRDPRLGALMTHVISAYDPADAEEPGAVVEMDSHGYELRYGTHNLDFPRYVYSNDCIIAGNFPRLYLAPIDFEPAVSVRYNKTADSLNKDVSVDTEKLWRLAESTATGATLHAILFRPNLLDLFAAFADSLENAYGSARVHWTWGDLFPAVQDAPAAGPAAVVIHPNPFRDGTELVISQEARCSSLRIYNCLGQRVFEVIRPADGRVRWDGRDMSGRDLPAGVYFCRFVGDTPSKTAKVVLVR